MKRKTPPTKTYKTASKRQKTEGRTAKSQSLAFQKNTVKRGPEVKNVDVDDTFTTGTQIPMTASNSQWTIGATQLLNGVAQGTTATTRLGRKTRGVKLNLNLTASLATTSTGGGIVRVRIVYDKQPNKAQFNITDYLSIDGYDSPLNLDNSDRFITLAVEDFQVSIQNNYSTSKKMNIKMDLESMYSGAGGTVAAITTGSIYLICAQDGQIATTGPSLGFYSRYRFVDN